MPLLHDFNRTNFLLLAGITSEAFGRRTTEHHIALALGCEVPAAQGRYLALDAVAMELTDQLRHHGIATRKVAAMLVRLHHVRWLNVLREAEWGSLVASYFAVGLVRNLDPEPSPLDPCFDGYFVATGTPKEIFTAVERKQALTNDLGLVAPVVALNMAQVLAVVQTRALAAGIELPRLTAEPGTPADAAMRAEIADYQNRSQARLRGKGRRRVPVPRSVRVSEANHDQGEAVQ